MTAERIQKSLANFGLGSRREIEQWIVAGRVSVNGKTAVLGQKIRINDKILVDKKPILLSDRQLSPCRVLLYHKPEGQICSRYAQEKRDSVFQHLPPLAHGRWVMVGRLDVNTSGLLLFTDSGALAHRLMHPRFGMEREYAVRVLGKVTPAMLVQLTKGVRLEQGQCRFQKVEPLIQRAEGANQWYRCLLTEGKYREVRALWASLGCTVSRLIRVKYGEISLPRDLPKGQWRELNAVQINRLTAQ